MWVGTENPVRHSFQIANFCTAATVATRSEKCIKEFWISVVCFAESPTRCSKEFWISVVFFAESPNPWRKRDVARGIATNELPETARFNDWLLVSMRCTLTCSFNPLLLLKQVRRRLPQLLRLITLAQGPSSPVRSLVIVTLEVESVYQRSLSRAILLRSWCSRCKAWMVALTQSRPPQPLNGYRG